MDRADNLAAGYKAKNGPEDEELGNPFEYATYHDNLHSTNACVLI